MNPARLAFRTLLGRRLPITSGTLQVQGIEQRVTIRRDRWGVPYIEAATDADAWYGLGFCQGQDRAFQIDMLVRVGCGTLAELIGPDALQMDRLSRRIGFHYYARAQLEVLDPGVRACLDAFARGVNEGNTLGCRRRAHEFALLRATPTLVDAVALLAGFKYIAFSLSTWEEKLSRWIVYQQDGPQAVRDLADTYPSWLRVSRPPGAPAGPALNRLAQDLSQLAEVLGRRGGSNSWALSASRTATGRPILANDPHLGARLPAPWYLAHVRTPEWAIAGAVYAGSPGFASAHNEAGAWGPTAGLADNVDLYLEEIGEDGRSVREGDRIVPCEVRRETIHVKGKPPVVEEVLVTPRGPVISPAMDGELGAISMRATWMDPRPAQGVLSLNRVESFDDFRGVLSLSTGPSLNMVYADTSDTIGWQLTGDVPQRKGAWNTVPIAGWDPDTNQVPDTLPADQMPHVRDPACGYVATANNKPVRDDDGPYVGMFWLDGYRHARIVELLEERDDWDLDAARHMQMDQTPLPWREMRAAVLGTPVETAEAQTALDLLRAWDGVVNVDSPTASVYGFFLSEMVQRITRAKAPNAFEWAQGRGFNPLIAYSTVSAYRISLIVRLLCDQPDGWFDRPWPVEIADALGAAVTRLQAKFGPSPDRWAWGHVRPLTLTHAFGSRRPLARVFNLGPFPWGGDDHTISAAIRVLADPTVSPPGIANLRMVVDVGNWEANRFVIAGGQSGNPLSPHYADLLALWREGDGITIPWSEAEIARVAESTLRLGPLTLPMEHGIIEDSDGEGDE